MLLDAAIRPTARRAFSAQAPAQLINGYVIAGLVLWPCQFESRTDGAAAARTSSSGGTRRKAGGAEGAQKAATTSLSWALSGLLCMATWRPDSNNADFLQPPASFGRKAVGPLDVKVCPEVHAFDAGAEKFEWVARNTSRRRARARRYFQK